MCVILCVSAGQKGKRRGILASSQPDGVAGVCGASEEIHKFRISAIAFRAKFPEPVIQHLKGLRMCDLGISVGGVNDLMVPDVGRIEAMKALRRDPAQQHAPSVYAPVILDEIVAQHFHCLGVNVYLSKDLFI
nr:hypothetical protein [uncultured Dysosmobacter sp.]